MANISTVVATLEFEDENNDHIKVDLDSPELEKFVDAFCDMSYDGKGDYSAGQFTMFGRWAFDSNFGWVEIVSAYCEELKKVVPNARFIKVSYRESEPGMDFLYEAMAIVDTSDYSHEDNGIASYSYESYGTLLKLEQPLKEKFESEDEYYDAMFTWQMEVEDSFFDERENTPDYTRCD